jgi:hypothetical protein
MVEADFVLLSFRIVTIHGSQSVLNFAFSKSSVFLDWNFFPARLGIDESKLLLQEAGVETC